MNTVRQAKICVHHMVSHGNACFRTRHAPAGRPAGPHMHSASWRTEQPPLHAASDAHTYPAPAQRHARQMGSSKNGDAASGCKHLLTNTAGHEHDMIAARLQQAEAAGSRERQHVRQTGMPLVLRPSRSQTGRERPAHPCPCCPSTMPRRPRPSPCSRAEHAGAVTGKVLGRTREAACSWSRARMPPPAAAAAALAAAAAAAQATAAAGNTTDRSTGRRSHL